MNDKSKKFEKWFLEIYTTYFNSYIHLEIYWLLLNPSRIQFIKQHKYYFNFDIYAHLSMGVLSLLRIFDKDKKSINIKNFLQYCKKNKKIIENDFNSCKFCDNKIIQKIHKEIDSLAPDIKALKKWRNKHIAHNEMGSKPRPIKWKQFDNIFIFLEKYFLDYGSKPNHLFSKPDDKESIIVQNIEKFFNNYFKNNY